MNIQKRTVKIRTCKKCKINYETSDEYPILLAQHRRAHLDLYGFPLQGICPRHRKDQKNATEDEIAASRHPQFPDLYDSGIRTHATRTLVASKTITLVNDGWLTSYTDYQRRRQILRTLFDTADEENIEIRVEGQHW